MVVCKFFLQGRCKFGQNCKYEHSINDNTQNHSVSIMRQMQSPEYFDMNSLVKSVQTDMISAEKGHQWVLSSYAPFKDKPGFPGFEDKSFEEVRYGFYQASKSGTIEQFAQQFQTEIKNAVLKSKALQNPSAEAVHILSQIYNSPDTESFTSSQSIPDRDTPNTLLHGSSNFNSNALSKSIFTQNNQTVFRQPSVFADTKSNIFNNTGNSKQSSIFSGPMQSNSNIFGGGQKSIFAGSQSYSGSTFGQQENTLFNQNSMLNPTFKQPSSSLENPFKTQTNNPPFSSQMNAAGNSPFKMQDSAPVFRQNQPSNSPLAGNFIANQPSSVFNMVSQTLPFKVQQENNSYVGNNSSFNIQQSQTTSSIFDNNRMTDFDNAHQQNSMFPPMQQAPHGLLGDIPEEKPLGSNVFGTRSASSLSIINIDETVYSKMENLSESDIQAFQSDHFEFGKIPEKPPTLQMCF